jgi:hypothetical protein
MQNLVDRLIEANRLLAQTRLILRNSRTPRLGEVEDLLKAIDKHFAQVEKTDDKR